MMTYFQTVGECTAVVTVLSRSILFVGFKSAGYVLRLLCRIALRVILCVALRETSVLYI